MSGIVMGLVLAVFQTPAQFAVVEGADTIWVPADQAIEVIDGAEVTLLPVVFDSTGATEATEAWWHSGDNEVYSLEKDGTFETFAPGEHEVMFHWRPLERDPDARKSEIMWVMIRVVGQDTEGPES